MKIRSLLLGSAAAMVAVSGAQAADAVVVEAEPVEYVRICDAYGAGYFYIPGSETCLKFSGYVRSTYVVYDDLAGQADPSPATRDTWFSRARFDIDTRNETDWGTLRGFMRFQASAATGDAGNSSLEIDAAFIQIAGLRVGIAGSLFNANFTGINYNEHVVGVAYGFANHHVIDYTFAFDGLSIAIGAENHVENGAEESINFIGRIQYDADWGLVGFVAAHDDNVAAANRGDAYKFYTQIDLSEFVPGGKIAGFYAWEDADTLSGNTNYIGFDESWGVGAQFNLTDAVEVFAYYHSTENDSDGGVTDTADYDQFGAGINWYPVEQLKLYAEYGYRETDAVVNDETSGFAIGIRRSF